MTASIVGMGVAQPVGRIAQADSAELNKSICQGSVAQHARMDQIYRRSLIQQRASVILPPESSDAHAAAMPAQDFFPPAVDAADRGPTTRQRMERYEQAILPLGCEASRAALAEAGVMPGQITDLVTASCTGFFAPGLDVGLMQVLGLAPTVSRTHVGFMGCHGAFNALRVARGLVAENPRAVVLVCAAELCSLHMSYGWDVGRVVSNALFADGAGAVVVMDAEQARVRGSKVCWAVRGHGSAVFPDSQADMQWHIGDHGFEMTLSARVPELIAQHVGPWLDPWLAGQGVGRGDIAAWAIHPGGPKIVLRAVEALGLAADDVSDSLAVLGSCGNMSSPTILFILQRLVAAGRVGKCVALGFGPGLTVEGMLLELGGGGG